MTLPLDQEIVALKISAVLDHVLGKMAHDARAALPPIEPTITAEWLELRAGELLVAAIPMWWLLDGDDWLLPNLQRYDDE